MTIRIPAKYPAYSRWTSVGKRSIHYFDSSAEASGDARPVLVFIHGFMGSGAEALPLIRELAQEYRILAPDCPGSGFSSRDDIERGMKTYSLFVSEWVSHLRDTLLPGTGRITLVAHSMGGHMAIQALHSYPPLRKAVERLILLAPDGIPREEGPMLLIRHPLIFDLSRAVLSFSLFRISVALRVFYDIRKIDSAWLRLMWKSRTVVADKGALARIGITVLATHQVRNILETIDLPVLLLWGKQDRVLRFRWSKVFRSLLPAVRLHGIDRCGHLPHVEQIEVVAGHVRAFIQNDSYAGQT